MSVKCDCHVYPVLVSDAIMEFTLYHATLLFRTPFVNPFTLIAAKRGLTILEIFSLQKHFFENI